VPPASTRPKSGRPPPRRWSCCSDGRSSSSSSTSTTATGVVAGDASELASTASSEDRMGGEAAAAAAVSESFGASKNAAVEQTSSAAAARRLLGSKVGGAGAIERWLLECQGVTRPSSINRQGAMSAFQSDLHSVIPGPADDGNECNGDDNDGDSSAVANIQPMGGSVAPRAAYGCNTSAAASNTLLRPTVATQAPLCKLSTWSCSTVSTEGFDVERSEPVPVSQ
jgi:hypothetical protein